MKERLIKVIKFLLGVLLWYSGIAIIYRFIFNCLCGNPVTILCIHGVIDRTNGKSNLAKLYLKIGHIELIDLEYKLRFLKENYKIISLDEYLDICERGGDLPYKSFVLTFDDGDLEHYTDVYPLLKKMEIPATFFISTEYITNNICKWNDRIASLIAETKKGNFKIKLPSLKVREFTIKTLDKKAETICYLWKNLKYIPDKIKDKFIERLQRVLGIYDYDKRLQYRKVMTWDQIRVIASDPLMSIGAHSRTHPVLAMLKEEEISYEIKKSKEEIEENTGIPITLFSYPFGKMSDYDQRVKRIVKDVGFRAACTFCYGRNYKKTDRFELKRIPLLPEPFSIFKARMSGIFDFISKGRERNN